MIRAVVFDFGRVISAQKPESLFRTYEKDLGLAPGSINTIMFQSRLWEETLVGEKSLSEYWHALGPCLGLSAPAEVERFRRRYFADEAINHQVVDLIRALHGRYRLAVLSNAPSGLSEWLAQWEILDFFDVVFCSGDEGVVKPQREAYERTLCRLGVESEEAVFIDDTPGHVEAARTLGMKAVLFTDAARLAEDLAPLLEHVCKSHPLSPPRQGGGFFWNRDVV